MSQSGTRLTFILALALTGACGEASPSTVERDEDDIENVDDDDTTADREDEDNEVVDEDQDEDDDPAPPAMAGKDAGAPVVSPVRDSGPGAPARDSGVPAAIVDGGKPAADSGMSPSSDGGPVTMGDGMCCDDGNCTCHGDAPSALTSAKGPYEVDSYDLTGTGCVYYPKDGKPPYAAVAVSDGFIGTGGCGRTQTDQWGPLYASWGIVTMIVNTGSSDQPNVRGRALTKGIAAFKTENTKSGSPLEGKLAGRYGTSGFSMGGGGTSYASQADKTLLSSVAIMPWGPVTSGVTVPTLVICGSSDGTAPCSSHGNPLYRGIGDSTPKMRVQVSSGHSGQPTAGMSKSGQYGLAFQKVFLEGDKRWRPLLVAASSEETNIK
jgi:hypothetical protein